MSVESVRAHLRKWNLENQIREFDESSATVTEAALALGCEEKRIAKTMSFLLDDKAVLVVLAGDARVDNSKYKALFQKKATFLKEDLVYELTGHPIGGVCPFAVAEGASVYLDLSLKRFDSVFPAAGSRNSCVELTISQLEETTAFKDWIDIGKDWA